MAELFTHVVEGVGELRFAHLSLYDVFGDPAKDELNGFVPTHRRRLRKQLLQDLTDAGVDQLQRLAELAEFSRKELGLDDFLQYLSAPTAAAEVVRFAYAKGNDKQAMPALPAGGESDVLWALLAPLGILPAKRGEAATDAAAQTYGDGGGDPVNPQIPPTYSATPSATEATTGAESGTGSPNAAS